MRYSVEPDTSVPGLTAFVVLATQRRTSEWVVVFKEEGPIALGRCLRVRDDLEAGKMVADLENATVKQVLSCG